MPVLFLVKAVSAEAGRDLRQKALVGIFGSIIGFVIGGGGVMHPLPEGGTELVPLVRCISKVGCVCHIITDASIRALSGGKGKPVLE